MFFKKKYTYTNHTRFGYKWVIPSSIPDRKVRIRDLSVLSDGDLHVISDHGFKDTVICSNINEELVAKCAFYVETNMGGYFCSTIKEAIKTYLIKQQEYESRYQYLTHKLEICTINKNSKISIYDNLLLEFVENGISPIYINNFTGIICDEFYLYGFKDSINGLAERNPFSIFQYLPPPRIEYGIFYIKNNEIICRISEDLLQTSKIDVRIPVLSKLDFLNPKIKEFGRNICFEDDILYYKDYNTYLSEYKSHDRQEKISTILNGS